VVHEEYGWLTDDKRQEYLSKTSNVTRLEAIGLWQATSLKEKMPDMYGFTIYLDDAEAKQLVYEHAKKVNALNKK
jgi:mannan endo-1,4-beta-mannosidase